MYLFIDTNILLSFYHLTSDELEELKKLSVLIDKGEINLILPKQVVNEFRRNRENKIGDSIKRFTDQKLKPQFPQICKDYPEYQGLIDSQKKYKNNHSELLGKLQEDIKNHQLKADIIIEVLIQKANIIDYDDDIIKNAKLRVALGNPPGKEGSLGDAVNWETVLKTVDATKDIHFVADDKDYYSVLDNNSIKDFLALEWSEKMLSQIHFYRRLSAFFKTHFPEIKLASEIEKELLIKDLSNSTCFSQTHNIVGKLSLFTDFTAAQVDEILRITLTNQQVKWIVGDLDIKEFLESIISGKEDKLETLSLTRIQNILAEEYEFKDVSEDIEELFKYK